MSEKLAKRTKESTDDTRMCVACRHRFLLENEQLRFALAKDGTIGFDIKGILPGRGAWVCASRDCLVKAVQRKAFERAFDAAVIVQVDELVQQVVTALQKNILQNLGLGLRASQCIPGREKVRELFEKNTLVGVVVAEDLTENSKNELKYVQEQVQLLTGPSKQVIGHALGRSETGVVGLLKGRISDRLVIDLKRLSPILAQK